MTAKESTHVWITHPKLTPAHDQKILREALGTHMNSGWAVREDQTDPVEVLDVPEPSHVTPAPSRRTSKES